jgi:hypothetical protein
MHRTVYRTVGSVRRSPRPKTSGSAPAIGNAFDGLLMKLGLASKQLSKARRKVR